VSDTIIIGEFDYCGKRECQVGNLITDALYESFPVHRANSESHPDNLNFVAMIEANDIWNSINVQNKSDYQVTLAEILYIFPVERCAWTQQMTGTQLKYIFENSIMDYHQETSSDKFLQISGNLQC